MTFFVSRSFSFFPALCLDPLNLRAHILCISSAFPVAGFFLPGVTLLNKKLFN